MFNCEAYLPSVVDGVRRQTLQDWELVLFDDGSRDATLAMASRYAAEDSRIRTMAGTNGGTARARNRGFAATSADSQFVIFLDNDDIWEPYALESLANALDEQPSAPAAYGLARSIDSRGEQFAGDDLAEVMARRRELRNGRIVELPTDAPTTFEALVLENYPVTPGTTLIRRSVRQAVGDFTPETVPCDDWDMHLRIARHGPIVLVNRVVLNWRRYPGAASYTTARWRDAYLRVRGRTLRSHENSFQQRVAAQLAFRHACRDALAAAKRELGRGQVRATARAFARWALFEFNYRQAVWGLNAD